MLKDLKNTVKQSAVYGLSRVAAKLAAFILIPLYTAKFVPGAIANINLLESFWQYLFTICMFGFETAIINFCASQNSDSRRRTLLFNFFILLLINSCIIILAGFFYSGAISRALLNEPNLGNAIFYCFLISAFESLLIMPLTIARLNDKPILYTVITISSLLINLALQLYFILGLHSDIIFIFLAKFIAPAAVFLGCIPYVLRYLSFKIDFTEIKHILKFSFPLMLASLLSLLLNTVDRFILTDYVTKQDVAIYTTGYSFGSVTNAFILSPFTLAINVIFWKKINEDNFRRFMTKSSTYLFTAMIFVSFLISLFIPFIMKILVRNELLWPAGNIVPFILFSNCFVALFLFSSLDFYYKKKTQGILYIIAVCLVFNFITNIIFIKFAGIYASAVITVFSYILMVLLGGHFTRTFSFTKFELYQIILLSISFIIFVGVSFIVSFNTLYLEAAFKLLLIFLFILILYIFKFFEPVEIERIRGFFNKYLFKKLR